MTRKVITVTEDMPLEEAARIMADNGIGGLPVMRNKEVVGIITETTLFRIFLEMLGGRRAGVRVTVSVLDAPGELAKLSQAIYEQGGTSWLWVPSWVKPCKKTNDLKGGRGENGCPEKSHPAFCRKDH